LNDIHYSLDKTPLQAADIPVMDAIAKSGICGQHDPVQDGDSHPCDCGIERVADKDEPLFSDAPESRFRQLAKDSPYRIHIMGHSHVPYHKIVDGVHFINPGSVGRMFDGDPRTSFAILKVSPEKIDVELFRIPYPVKAVVNGIQDFLDVEVLTELLPQPLDHLLRVHAHPRFLSPQRPLFTLVRREFHGIAPFPPVIISLQDQLLSVHQVF
jgi:diadenosine tetraphosphatase ApaH/serine/threonine PP2A family protein phosphatase